MLNLKNTVKNLRSILKEETLAPLSTFYNYQYPPTKFLKIYQSKICIKCILCGFPRTGTHWIRNVIEKSTGKKTYDLYTNKPTHLDNEVLLLKIHARNKQIAYLKALWLLPRFNFEGKYIYIYRDPRDSIISMYEMYKKEKKNNSITPKEYLKAHDPIGQYRWEIKEWVLKKHKNVYIVKFENLRKNPEIYFKKIFVFLNLDFPIAIEFIDKLIATSDEAKRPRGTVHGWKNTCISEYKFIVDQVQNKLNKEIELIGYE